MFIFTALPQQQYLRERASVLFYTYSDSLKTSQWNKVTKKDKQKIIPNDVQPSTSLYRAQ
jgi:hypothetical protein